MPRTFDVPKLAEGVRAGDRAAVAQAITLVESKLPAHRPMARQLLTDLTNAPTHAVRVGISGVPGAGKSTFINSMGQRLIEQGHKVAVLAVDPSSTRTGGSVLGDRTRMGELTQSSNAFVRPSPSGNHLGGVARATREAMLVVEAAGYDVIIVETVGVGQSEVAVAGMVDTFLMLALARSGDQLQGIKRGILEITDVIAVNKADGDNAGEARVTARELSIAMKLVQQSGDRRVPVLTCSALQRISLDEVWQAVLDHRAWLEENRGLAQHRAEQQVVWMHSQLEATLLDSMRSSEHLRELNRQLEDDVRHGRTSAMEATADFLADFAQEVPTMDWARGKNRL
ncbi:MULTISPECIES: methylmalonyl Co-A mutase-associated GTPase MeaB [unclassified Luteococcus]|uniref:methylmalonyl Co-A mutase-associated GTPase MeaB n=1 Tax=unclassified Luteococcus TaxID=2639923 RepID=UPI00313ADE36